MTLWDRCQEIYEVIDVLLPEQQKFINTVIENGDIHNLYEELTEKQIRWIYWLYAKYVEGIERPEW